MDVGGLNARMIEYLLAPKSLFFCKKNQVLKTVKMQKLIILILAIFFISDLVFSQNQELLLYKLDYKVDSCGDAKKSSTLYSYKKGTLIDIDDFGNVICNLKHHQNNSKKICKIKLAGIEILTDKNYIIEELRDFLIGQEIEILTTHSKATTDTYFEGLLYHKDYLINYSLLLIGVARFRYAAYTLDFWISCEFEEAENIYKNRN